MDREWQGPLKPDAEPAPVGQDGPEAVATPPGEPLAFEYQVNEPVGTPIEDTSSGRIKIGALSPFAPERPGAPIHLNPRAESPRALRRNIKREADLYGLARSLQVLSFYIVALGFLSLAQSHRWRLGHVAVEDLMPVGVILVFAASFFELGRRLQRLSEGARWLTLLLNVAQVFIALAFAVGLQGPAIFAAAVVAGLSTLNIWVLVGDSDLAMFRPAYRALVAESESSVSAAASLVYWVNVIFYTVVAAMLLLISTVVR